MTTRKVELFYYPVFKSSKVPAKEELRRKIVKYFMHHPDLRPQQREPWYFCKVSPGFNYEAVDGYLIMTPQPLKESERTDGMVRYSSIELYNFLKRGTLLLETTGNIPKIFNLV